MINLVTIAQAREHLRIDNYDSEGGPDDPWLNIFIPATSQAVAEWVKVEARLYEPELDSDGQVVVDSDGEPVPALDSDDQPTPKHIVVAAVLIELERQYRSRGGEDDTDVDASAGHGYVLGKGSTGLLAPLRRSTVA